MFSDLLNELRSDHFGPLYAVSETAFHIGGRADGSLLPEFCGPGFSLGGSASLFCVSSFPYSQ